MQNLQKNSGNGQKPSEVVEPRRRRSDMIKKKADVLDDIYRRFNSGADSCIDLGV